MEATVERKKIFQTKIFTPPAHFPFLQHIKNALFCRPLSYSTTTTAAKLQQIVQCFPFRFPSRSASRFRLLRFSSCCCGCCCCRFWAGCGRCWNKICVCYGHVMLALATMSIAAFYWNSTPPAVVVVIVVALFVHVVVSVVVACLQSAI